MSQHDLSIENADANTGLLMRAAINAALQALATASSGNLPPAVTYPCMFWANTSPGVNIMYQRNTANTDWVALYNLGSGPSIPSATDAAAGSVRLATTAEVTARTAGVALTPATAAWLAPTEALPGLVKFASNAAAVNYTAGAALTPPNLPSIISVISAYESDMLTDTVTRFVTVERLRKYYLGLGSEPYGTTSGSLIWNGGIKTWVRRVKLLIADAHVTVVSGTVNFILRLGDASAYIDTGAKYAYTHTNGATLAAVNNITTNPVLCHSIANGDRIQGSVELTYLGFYALTGKHEWYIESNFTSFNTSKSTRGCGIVFMTNPLTRVMMTLSGGSATFTDGTSGNATFE